MKSPKTTGVFSVRSRATLYVERDLVHTLRGEAFRVKQRVLGALDALAEDGGLPISELSVPASSLTEKRHEQSEGWFVVAHPSDRVSDSVGGAYLWWRALPHERAFEVRRSPSLRHPPEGEASAEGGVSRGHKTLIEFEPLAHWVRSPEQAMIRRELLTLGDAALLIKAPRSAGVSSGLAAAITDWLASSSGECVLITHAAERAERLIEALAPSSVARAHVITPSALIKLLTPQPPGAPLDRTPLLGGRLSDRLELEAWMRWCAWLAEHETALGGWAADPHQLRRALIHGVLSAGDPRRVISASPALARLDDEARSSLFELGVRLWESELGRAHRLLYERPSVTWPWPEARALIIDDCLELSWPVLYSALRLADEHLGASGRRWTLALAGDASGDATELGVSWRDLEALMRGALGRSVHTLRLYESARLHNDRARELRTWVMQSGLPEISDHPLPSPLPHISGVSISRDQPQRPLVSWVDLESAQAQPLSELDVITHAIQTCAATPGAYLLDLSSTPGESLLARGLHERLPSELRRVVPERVISSRDLASLEVKWLIVYQPQRSPRSSLTPERAPRQTLASAYALGELWYLLTRTSNPLVWIGARPQLDVGVEACELSHILSEISASSPWGGISLFHTLERAREHAKLERNQEALACWRDLTPKLSYLWGERGRALALDSIAELSLLQLNVLIEASLFQEASACVSDLYAALSSEPTPRVATLKRAVSVTLKSALTSLLKSGAETLELRVYDELTRALSSIMIVTSIITQSVTPDAPVELEREIKELKRWSDVLREEPIPQAALQAQLLACIHALDPHPLYSPLIDGYRATPTPQSLAESAARFSQVHAMGQQNDELADARYTWGLEHLRRWLRYLVDARSASTLEGIKLATPELLALGFAVSAARVGAWESADLLRALSAHPDARPLTSSSAAALQREWERAFHESAKQRSFIEVTSDLRRRGDLMGLARHHQRAQRALPQELAVAVALLEQLEATRASWHLLSDAERAVIEESCRGLLDATPPSRQL